MLRLDRLSKDFREAGALNQQINLYGFIDEHTFLTKTGDVLACFAHFLCGSAGLESVSR